MRLQGINEIEKYIKRSIPTIMDWYRHEFFPMVKIGGSWESSTEKIDAWHNSRIDGRVNDRIEASLNGTEIPDIQIRKGVRGRKTSRK